MISIVHKLRWLKLLIAGIFLCGLMPAKGTASDDSSFEAKDYLSRMFIAPNGRLLPSGMVSVAFGGAFASQGGREYLGLISVGLGEIAEFEFSTSHLVTNIFNVSEPIGTTSLKFMVYRGDPEYKIPSAMLALRSNRWSSVKGSGSELAGPADNSRNDIAEVEFETHLTSLYLSLTSDLNPKFTVHGGFVLHDVRTRDLNYGYYIFNPNRSDTTKPGDLKESELSVSAGIEHVVNENTFSMFEFGSKPKITFNSDMRKMQVEQLWYGMAGVRFFFTKWTALDAGIKYRSDYSGLADAEIRIGLNVSIDIINEFKEKVWK